MKIRPVILCGGAGTRLWPNLKKHQAKQFINFGGWTLFGRTLERIKPKYTLRQFCRDHFFIQFFMRIGT